MGYKIAPAPGRGDKIDALDGTARRVSYAYAYLPDHHIWCVILSDLAIAFVKLKTDENNLLWVEVPEP